MLVGHRTPVDQEVRELEGDVVEHDRGDHLVGSKASLQQTRDLRPQKTTQHPETKRERDVHDGRQAVQVVAGENSEYGPQVELSLGADVEQPGSESKRDRQTEKDVWHGRQQR